MRTSEVCLKGGCVYSYEMVFNKIETFEGPKNRTNKAAVTKPEKFGRGFLGCGNSGVPK